MQWRGRRESGNVEDRRGMKLAGGLGGAGFIVALLYFLITGDPSGLNQNSEVAQNVQQTPAETEEVGPPKISRCQKTIQPG